MGLQQIRDRVSEHGVHGGSQQAHENRLRERPARVEASDHKSVHGIRDAPEFPADQENGYEAVIDIAGRTHQLLAGEDPVRLQEQMDNKGEGDEEEAVPYAKCERSAVRLLHIVRRTRCRHSRVSVRVAVYHTLEEIAKKRMKKGRGGRYVVGNIRMSICFKHVLIA